MRFEWFNVILRQLCLASIVSKQVTMWNSHASDLIATGKSFLAANTRYRCRLAYMHVCMYARRGQELHDYPYGLRSQHISVESGHRKVIEPGCARELIMSGQCLCYPPQKQFNVLHDSEGRPFLVVTGEKCGDRGTIQNRDNRLI